MPTSPDPGTTSRPSGVTTRASGPRVKPGPPDGPAPSSSAVVVDAAIPIASDDPRLSTRMSRGLCSSNTALVAADHITPEDVITRSEEMSHRPGSASRARAMGRAKASPTIARLLTRSRSIVSSNSVAEKLRPVRVTMLPPLSSAAIDVNAPVPCMSGAHGTWEGPGLTSRDRTSSRPPSSGYRTAAVRLSNANTSSWRHMTPLGMPVVPPV